ncbi:hypothetical protein ABZZ47_25675 [Streptomyces sp. NPDC006465]|uniref:hypothetical protein n=1 Tax=Streptomyces sp. NPDC006465 TaxID=3157174 RepID=UPI0033A4F5CC
MRGSVFRGSRRRSGAAVAAMVAFSTALAGQHHVAAEEGATSSVPPLELDWRVCVQGSPYDCATARVPLDYSRPRGRTIELAVIKRKATGPGRRIGTLLFNPGGPGGPTGTEGVGLRVQGTRTALRRA